MPAEIAKDLTVHQTGCPALANCPGCTCVAYNPAQGCPKCGGAQGFHFTMTEEIEMVGGWGQTPETGDSGGNIRNGLVTCYDCGHRFQMRTLTNLGAIA
jgi:hypothetical protein